MEDEINEALYGDDSIPKVSRGGLRVVVKIGFLTINGFDATWKSSRLINNALISNRVIESYLMSQSSIIRPMVIHFVTQLQSTVHVLTGARTAVCIVGDVTGIGANTMASIDTHIYTEVNRCVVKEKCQFRTTRGEKLVTRELGSHHALFDHLGWLSDITRGEGYGQGNAEDITSRTKNGEIVDIRRGDRITIIIDVLSKLI
jgi:hypothetical protein